MVDKKVRELYVAPITRYIRLPFYRPAQTYIIYILISLELRKGIYCRSLLAMHALTSKA